MGKQKIFDSFDFNGNEIERVSKIEITEDAANSNDAVRLSQAQTISSNSVQSSMIENQNLKSSDTVYTSEYTQMIFNTKQNNLSIDPSSTQYLSLENDKISVKNLTVGKVYKDTSNTSLAEFISNSTFNGDGTLTIEGESLDARTLIFLINASNPTDKVYIYTGGNTETSEDFINDSDTYDQSAIRQMFSKSGKGLSYDSSTGVMTIVYGVGADELGGQNIPHGANFTVISSNGKIDDAMEKLEALIVSVETSGADGTATLTTRLNNLMGVNGANMTTFSQGLFSDNKNIYQLMQESELLHKAAINDRAAIRNENASSESILQSNIDTEQASRIASDANLQSKIDIEETNRVQADASINASIANEISIRTSEDNLLKARLDIVEGDGEGSISKAKDDANTYSDNLVNAEKNRAIIVENAMQSMIDSLVSGNIELVATIDGEGKFNAVEDDVRNMQLFENVSMVAGEVVVFSEAVTLMGNDFKVNDKLMCKVASFASGQADLDKFVYTKADESDVTKANVGSDTIDLDANEKLYVKDNSIKKYNLHQDLKNEVDDKMSLTNTNSITGDASTHFVSSSSTDAQQNIYFKRDQMSSSALSGTARTVLGELHVSSNGSGNPASPSYAHTTTMATHYKGNCVDLSMVIAGGNFEGNGSETTATQATGVYGTATKQQLGINVGGVFAASGAMTSNLGAFGFSSTDGLGSDRGVYAAVSNLNLPIFSATRAADPIPHNDIALVADAKYAPEGSKALYSYGDSIFEGGSVIVPNATLDGSAVNLGDIKNRQKIYKFDLSDGVEKVITVSGVDLEKSIYQIVDNYENVVMSVIRDVTNSQLKIKATGASLTDVKLLLSELSCDVENV